MFEHTFRFREVAAAVAKLRPDTFALNGEIAVFDEKLVSRFDLPFASRSSAFADLVSARNDLAGAEAASRGQLRRGLWRQATCAGVAGLRGRQRPRSPKSRLKLPAVAQTR